MARSLVRLTSPLKSHPIAESFRMNCQVLRSHLINHLVHCYHSASAELYPAYLFDRIFGAERAVVGRTVVEEFAEFERIALVVRAVAVEGLLVVVDQTAALAGAAVVSVD